MVENCQDDFLMTSEFQLNGLQTTKLHTTTN